MPTYFVTWTATVRGCTRIDAENADDAEHMLLSTEPLPFEPRADVVASLDVTDVEHAVPGTTWN